MQNIERIPSLPNKSLFAMNRWFYEMDQAGLLYHPDEQAENIVDIATGSPTFTQSECKKLNALMDEMVATHGGMVYKVCLNITHEATGIRP